MTPRKTGSTQVTHSGKTRRGELATVVSGVRILTALTSRRLFETLEQSALRVEYKKGLREGASSSACVVVKSDVRIPGVVPSDHGLFPCGVTALPMALMHDAGPLRWVRLAPSVCTACDMGA